ncbi:MAG: deoxyribodipyrimidine photo-lyase [Patescibacteria group bacterium]
MNQSNLIVYWIRRDFRLEDNPALYAASQKAKSENTPLLPVFILDPGILDEPNIGYPRRYSLAKILSRYAQVWPRCWIIFSKPDLFFSELSQKYRLTIFANDDIEPYAHQRDSKIEEIVSGYGGELKLFRDQLSVKPDTRTQTGNLFSVFTPFRNAVVNDFLDNKPVPKVLPSEIPIFSEQAPNDLTNYILFDTANTSSDSSSIENQENLDQLIFKKIDKPWVIRIKTEPESVFNLDQIWGRPDLTPWYFEESSAWDKANQFINNDLQSYKENRDSLELDASDFGHTSRLSLALKWGLLSPRSLTQKILSKFDRESVLKDPNMGSFINELIWREFYRYILFNFPDVVDLEFQEKYQKRIKWIEQKEAITRFEAWIKGQTGYLLVDACMHQVAKLSWMHNRGRMVVASILSKNLGVDWRWGQAYFEAVLIDHDLASNNGGWQWAASVGADPKPIRIFNPYLQAEKFDPKGVFQAKWLGQSILHNSPIVDHAQARKEAIERYSMSRSPIQNR